MPSNILEQESMKKLMAQLFKDLPTSKSQDIQDITVKAETNKLEAFVPVKEKVMPEQSCLNQKSETVIHAIKER